MPDVDQLIEAVLRLNREERAWLVEAVLASLEMDGLGAQREQAIAQRVDDLDSGSAVPVAGEQVFLRLAHRFRTKET